MGETRMGSSSRPDGGEDMKKEVINELALFAGAGGGILAGTLLGWRTVCAVEREPYSASVLVTRQNDGILDPFPIWDDVCTFDGKPWRGIVDVVSGGFPCQDISNAGKCEGIEGERSGLWYEMARIVGEVMPRFVFVENSSMLTIRGGTRVIADLAALGYSARWGVMGGFSAGACINGERMWIVATKADKFTMERLQIEDQIADASASSKRQFDRAMGTAVSDSYHAEHYRDSDAVACGMDRIKAIGNGQMPRVAARAFRILAGRAI